MAYAERSEAGLIAYATRAMSRDERLATRAKLLKSLARPETHAAIRCLWAEQMDVVQFFHDGDVVPMLRAMALKLK